MESNEKEIPQVEPEVGVEDGKKEEGEKKESVLSRIAEIVRDCGDRSSVHGCPSWASKTTHWSIKLIWLAIAFLSWGYFIYLLRSSFVTFYSYGVTTSSSIVQEAPTFFPGKIWRGIVSRFNIFLKFSNGFSGRHLQFELADS